MKILAIGCIGFFACTPQDLSVEGIWSYTNNLDEYAEIWFTKEKVVLIDESTFIVEILDLKMDKDSIYLSVEKEIRYTMAYSFRGKNILNLDNEFSKKSLNRMLFSVSTDLSKSRDELITEIRQDFSIRRN